MESVKILLVDNDENFLTAAQGFLGSGMGLTIVSTSLSGDQAVEKVRLLRPDIVLMDILMPCVDGIEAARRIKNTSGPPLVILLTTHDCIEYRCHASAAGADAFLLKEDFENSIFEIIDAFAARLPKQGADVKKRSSSRRKGNCRVDAGKEFREERGTGAGFPQVS